MSAKVLLVSTVRSMSVATMIKSEFASTEEVASALRSLTRADMARLRQLARIRSSGMAWLDWEDLLHEAIGRVLEGSRMWPRGVPFLAFMREVMRSIASEHWRRHVHGPVRSEADLGAEGNAFDLAGIAQDRPDPEREVLARQALDRVFTLFAEDPAATTVLAGMAQGGSPTEIQQAAGLSPTAYSTTQKRIRRTLVRAFPTKESWS